MKKCLLLAGSLLVLSLGNASAAGISAEFLIEKSHVGKVRLGMTRQDFYSKTYDRHHMRADGESDVIKVFLPGDPTPSSIFRTDEHDEPGESMKVYFGRQSTIKKILVFDPRFTTRDKLGPASDLGDIRKKRADLKMGEVVAEEKHLPFAQTNGIVFHLHPADYIEYEPSVTLPNDTRIRVVSIGD